MILQVSKSSSATPLDSTNWKQYVIPISVGSGSLDYQTLGMDANGLYLSVQLRQSSTRYGFVIQGFKKPDVYTSGSYTPPVTNFVSPGALDAWCIQPVYNFDSPVNGYAWFVAKGPSSGNSGGLIQYSHYYWSGNSFVWGDTSWQTVPDSTPTYRDYYDIPQQASFLAPDSGGSVSLGDTGSRLMMATIRNGYLWTCHHVGLNYQGTYTGGTADRSGVQWFQLQVASTGLTYNSSGRIYDGASSSPYWYYFPSLSINSSGNVLFGFSGSKTGENVGAFFTGWKASGGWMPRPTLVQGGRTAYTQSRLGDYSATTIDPNDGTFWTIQEFASYDIDSVENIWGTWVMQISP